MAPVAKLIREAAEDEEEFVVLSDSSSTFDLGEAAVSDDEDPAPEYVPDNPIGALQELCVSKGLAPPRYTEGPKTGPPHFPTFLVTCTQDKNSVSASATTKKRAKKEAAAGMLKKIQLELLSAATPPLHTVPSELSEVLNTLARFDIATNNNFEAMTTQEMEEFMSSVAQESNVSLIFHAESHIGGRSVRICELDGASITGYGKTAYEATADAARGVMAQLRIKLSSH